MKLNRIFILISMLCISLHANARGLYGACKAGIDLLLGNAPSQFSTTMTKVPAISGKVDNAIGIGNLHVWQPEEIRRNPEGMSEYEISTARRQALPFLYRDAHDLGIKGPEFDALRFYHLHWETGYDKIHSAITDGTLNDNPKLLQSVENLDSAIKKFGEFPYPVTVWRGLRVKTKKELETLLENFRRLSRTNENWHSKTFTSTSLNPEVAEKFAKGAINESPEAPPGIILEIKAKSGLTMEQVVHRHSEDEILLPRDSDFRVLSVTEEKILDENGVVQRRVFVRLEQK